MNDRRQIKLRLKKTGMYLQFLNADIDSIESIRENVTSQIEQSLQEPTEKLRKSANLLDLEIKGEKGKKIKGF